MRPLPRFHPTTETSGAPLFPGPGEDIERPSRLEPPTPPVPSPPSTAEVFQRGADVAKSIVRAGRESAAPRSPSATAARTPSRLSRRSARCASRPSALPSRACCCGEPDDRPPRRTPSKPAPCTCEPQSAARHASRNSRNAFLREIKPTTTHRREHDATADACRNTPQAPLFTFI